VSLLVECTGKVGWIFVGEKEVAQPGVNVINVLHANFLYEFFTKAKT